MKLTEEQIEGAHSKMNELAQTPEVKMFLLMCAALLENVDDLDIEPQIEGCRLAILLAP